MNQGNEEIKARIVREKLIFLHEFRNPIAAQEIPKNHANDPSKVKRFHFVKTDVNSHPSGFPKLDSRRIQFNPEVI